MIRQTIRALMLAGLFGLGANAFAEGPIGLDRCREDQERLCAGVRPGEGRIVRCLRERSSELSPECRQALQGPPSALGRRLSPDQSPDPEDGSSSAAQTSQELIARSKQQSFAHWQDAKGKGARIVPTPDGKSFYLVWTPTGKRMEDTPVIVGIHGHGSWAVNEFSVWHPFLEQTGYSLVALQWWFGGGESTSDYYDTESMSRLLDEILVKEKVTPGKAMLHGFSRGSTQTYGLTALDRKRPEPYFAVSMANAGGAAKDYPMNRRMESGEWGEKPLLGSVWILYCGMQDPNPDRDGCPAMERTKAWISGLGGQVPLLIEDPNADHGGFHHNPSAVKRALTAFSARLKPAR